MNSKPHGAWAMKLYPSCNGFGQNECLGQGPGGIEGCLDMMWAEGPGTDFSTHGHYINMTSTKYTKVACGFYTTPKGSIWSVQNFR